MGDTPVDPGVRREQVCKRNHAVATEPAGEYDVRTGREPAARFGYRADVAGALPDAAVGSSAGIRNAPLADISNGRPVPVEAMRDVDLWTG
jgi:hypothetical protein